MAQAVQRARDLAQRWGLDGARLADWVARNADGRDNSAGGAHVFVPSCELGDGGPTLELQAWAMSDGRAYLSVGAVWEREASEVG